MLAISSTDVPLPTVLIGIIGILLTLVPLVWKCVKVGRKWARKRNNSTTSETPEDRKLFLLHSVDHDADT